MKHPPRARVARTAVLVVALLVATIALAPLAGAQKNVLGKKQKAKGEPVPIGFITDDKTEGTDNSIETPVAEATVEWINTHRNGIAGRPIELVRCVSAGDPAKSSDCANEMIQAGVVAVVVGSNRFFQNLWQPLHDAGIPVFSFASGAPDALADPDSTFIFGPGSTALFNLNIGAAKNAKPKAKKVTVVAIDVPAATDTYKTIAPAVFDEAGLDMELVAVAAGTADMTPQMQRVVSDNPNGVVFVLGNDTFCIAAFNGLRTAGFEGTVTAIPQCFSDATRTAVPADFLDGIQISATGPIDDPDDPSMKQYYAVLDTFGAGDVDKSRVTGLSMFQGLAGLDIATQNLKGEVMAETIIEAARTMPWTVLPGTGGLHARCSGKAQPENPAVCMTASLAATLDAEGKAKKYAPVADEEIPA